MTFARTLLLMSTLLILQIAQCVAAPCAFLPPPKLAADAKMVVLAEGDSITAGIGSSTGDRSYVSLASPLLGPSVQLLNRAVSQSVLGWGGPNAPANSLYARRDSDVALLPKQKDGTVFVLTILIGRNDLVGYYGGLDQYLAVLQSYVTNMREAGWDRVVLGTLLPSTWVPFGAVRAAFNAKVRSPCWANEHGIDAIADFASIRELASDQSAAEQTYFVDGTHPSDAGYAAMAPVYAAAIDSLRR